MLAAFRVDAHGARTHGRPVCLCTVLANNVHAPVISLAPIFVTRETRSRSSERKGASTETVFMCMFRYAGVKGRRDASRKNPSERERDSILYTFNVPTRFYSTVTGYEEEN